MEEKHYLDQFDVQLLKLLQENSRAKNTELAKILNVTEGAIRKRISKLVKQGFIEKFTIQMDDRVMGVRAIVEISIEGNAKPSEIREMILQKITSGVEVIFELTGDVDMIVIFHCTSHEELSACIEGLRQINGVRKTRTHVVLRKTKLPNTLF